MCGYPIIEVLYWIAGILIVPIGLVGLWQLKLAKDQVEVSTKQREMSAKQHFENAKRHAVEKTLEELKRYADQIIPHLEEIDLSLKKAGMDFYKGAQDPHSLELTNDALLWLQTSAKIPQEQRQTFFAILNALESFAVGMICGLCDEDIAFYPTAYSFCQIIEYLSPIIISVRMTNKNFYQYSLRLYDLWKPRLDKEEITDKLSILNEQLKGFEPDQKINPIGTL